MSITSFRVENFKSIGKSQFFEFAKFNLIFGPNSAGKTSIVQALLLLNNLIIKAESDVADSKWGVELGGFKNYVHLHKMDSIVSLAATFKGIYHDRSTGNLRNFGISFQLSKLGIHSLKYVYNSIELISISRDKSDKQDHYTIEDINLKSSIFTSNFASYVSLLKNILPNRSEDEIEIILVNLAKFSLEGSDIDPEIIIVSASNPSLGTLPYSSSSTAPWEAPTDYKSRPSVRRLNVNQLMRYRNFFQKNDLHAIDSFYSRLDSLDPESKKIIYRRSLTPRLLEEIFESENILEEIYSYTEIIDIGIELADFILSCITFIHRDCAREMRNSSHVGPVRWHPNRRLYESELKRSGSAESRNWLSLFTGDQRINQLNSILELLSLNYEVQVRKIFIEDLNEELEKNYYDRVLEIKDKKNGINVAYRDVGTGLSQVVPVLVGLLSYHPILSMEQPELHLHPALQSKLADVIINSKSIISSKSRRRDTTFFIETHSEHLILRFQRRIREGLNLEHPSIASKDLKVFFASPSTNGLQVLDLEIAENGDFIDPWPGGFFDERIEEIL